MILVPTTTPGFKIVRAVSVMGHSGGGGHCEIRYEDCRVPVANRLGPEGAGFAIAQARLGPGRVHHCMRCIGGAQRAYEIMVSHAAARKVGGEPLGTKQFIQDFIAKSKMEIDQARLFTLYTAWKMDTVGKKEAAQEISMIKVIAANLLMDVCDRAIQTLGALGVTDDTPGRRDVAQRPLAAHRRRPGRGTQDGDRPARAEALGGALRSLGNPHVDRPINVVTRVHARAVFGRRVQVLARSLAALLPQGARVLDVGCGDGSVAALVMRAASRPAR